MPVQVTESRTSRSNYISHSLSPIRLRAYSGILYYAGNVSSSGIAYREPFVSDLATHQTKLLKVLDPRYIGSDPAGFTRVGSTVFFSGSNSANGRELWKTDGTEVGTVLVKNIWPGPGSSSPDWLVECGGKLLFSAEDGVHGKELWISDGTDAGTTLVKDINPGSDDSSISSVINWNGVLYFSARNQTNNSELWRSDGTTAGTYMLKDVHSLNSNPRYFTPFKGALYYQANSGASGAAELWKTDGTTNGTVLVHAIPSSAYESKNYRVVGDLLFFSAERTGATGDYELWKSDGTSAGTSLVKNISLNGSSDPHSLVSYAGKLYFVANDGIRNDQIWRSDGTAAGTELAHEIFNNSGSYPKPHALVPFMGKLLFRVTRDGYGMEWWETDGTPAGLKNVADIQPGSGSALSNGAYNSSYLVHENEMVFTAQTSASGVEIWKFVKKPLKPVITSITASGWVNLGGNLQLNGTVEEDPRSHQWSRNGLNISGAAGPSHQVTGVTLNHAGIYHLKAANVAGSVTSAPVHVGIIDKAASAVSYPEDGTLTLQVKAAAPGTLKFQWRRNGVPLTDGKTGAQTLTGSTKSKLVITKCAATMTGSYTCEVWMANPASPGDTIATVSGVQTVSVVRKPVLNMPAPGTWSVARSASGLQLSGVNGPVKFFARGLPPGVKLNPLTGELTGSPTAPRVLRGVVVPYRVTVYATNAAGKSAEVSFDWQVEPLAPKVQGVFHGLIARSTGLNGLAGEAAGLGGKIKFTTTGRGALSGSLTLGKAAHNFKGPVQVATAGGNATFSISINRKAPLPALTISGTLSAVTGELVSANLTDGSSTAVVTGRRRVAAPDLAGRYNTRLTPVSPPAGFPRGTGSLVITLSANGTVNWAGSLADGTTITGSSGLGETGHFPLHHMLYAGFGSVQGWPQMTTGGVAGSSDWFKARLPKTSRSYSNGFPLRTLNFQGARFSKPLSGESLIGLPSNLRVVMSEGGLMSSFQQPFSLTAKNTALMPAGAANAIKLTITGSTGKFTGSFEINDAGGRRKATISGFFISGSGKGFGYFLLPASGTSSSPIESGVVVIEAS